MKDNSNTNITYYEILTKSRNILKDTDWYPVLRTFLIGKEFEQIIAFLLNELNNDEHWFPKMSAIFKPFLLTPYKDLKCILYNNYYKKFMSSQTGCAFEDQNSYNVICKYTNKNFERGIEEFTEKGILCLNGTMTFPFDSNRLNKHYEVWKPFYNWILDAIPANTKIVTTDETPFKDKFKDITVINPVDYKLNEQDIKTFNDLLWTNTE